MKAKNPRSTLIQHTLSVLTETSSLRQARSTFIKIVKNDND